MLFTGLKTSLFHFLVYTVILMIDMDTLYGHAEKIKIVDKLFYGTYSNNIFTVNTNFNFR